MLNFAPQYTQLLISIPCTRPHDAHIRPFMGSFILFGLTKIHSNRSSISNSAEHSGQVVLPGLGSTLWLRQNGHFRKLSIVFCLSRTNIKPLADSFDLSALVGSVNDVCYFPFIKTGLCHYCGCINTSLCSLVDKLQYLVGGGWTSGFLFCRGFFRRRSFCWYLCNFAFLAFFNGFYNVFHCFFEGLYVFV